MVWKTLAQSGKKLIPLEADLGFQFAVHFTAPRTEQAAHPPEGKLRIKKNVLFVDEPLEQPVVLFDCPHIRVILQCNYDTFR